MLNQRLCFGYDFILVLIHHITEGIADTFYFIAIVFFQDDGECLNPMCDGNQEMRTSEEDHDDNLDLRFEEYI